MKHSWYLIALLGLFLIGQGFSVYATNKPLVNTTPIQVVATASNVGPNRSWEWKLAKADYDERIKQAEIARAKAEAEKKAKAEAAKKAKENAAKVPQASNAPRYTTAEEVAQIQAMVEARWPGQWECMNKLVSRESGWKVNAGNPSSGAYGLPQALPGSKMASYGEDWATNPITQINWMMNYIHWKYTDPCGANTFQASHNWY